MLSIRKNFGVHSMTMVKGAQDAETPDRAISVKLTAEVKAAEIADIISPEHKSTQVVSSFWDKKGDLILPGTSGKCTNGVGNLEANIHIGVGDEPVHTCHVKKLDALEYEAMQTKGMFKTKFNILIDGYDDAIYSDIHKAVVRKDLMNIDINQLDTEPEEEGQTTID